MNFKVEPDISKKAQKLEQIVSYGGYSDDPDPFHVRNLLLLNIYPKGPVTKQNVAFALEEIINQLPEPYSAYTERAYKKDSSLIRNSFRLVPILEAKKALDIALKEGIILGGTNYFKLSPSQNPDEFQQELFGYLDKKLICVNMVNLFAVKHCWNNNLIFLGKRKAALFVWFSSD